MAIIVRDPLVADNICEVDIQESDGCAEARRLYEDGYLVLLKNQRFDLDYPFLESLDFDVDGPFEITRKIKKYGSEKILNINSSNPSTIDKFVIDNIFKGDTGKLHYFQEQIRSGNAQSDALYARIFPKYHAYRYTHTWRFTKTAFENLHWDNFHIDEIFHQVRIFSNLAKSARLWRLSHRIDTFAESIYEREGLKKFAGENGDKLNNFINRDILGGMTGSCMDRLPKHHIAFEQGDVWLCETRIVAHQIYHGEKAFAAMYFNDPAEMDDSRKSFDSRLHRLHAVKKHHSSATADTHI